jgi:hypothetical protein
MKRQPVPARWAHEGVRARQYGLPGGLVSFPCAVWQERKFDLSSGKSAQSGDALGYILAFMLAMVVIGMLLVMAVSHG